MLDRFPQLKGTKITHAWTGNVAFTLDETPHMGRFDNLHYALGCNGSGNRHDELSGPADGPQDRGQGQPRERLRPGGVSGPPLYNGSTWFLPWVGRYFRTRDWIDRRFG